MGDEKSNAEIAEDVERLVKKPVSNTQRKLKSINLSMMSSLIFRTRRD